MTFIVVIKRLGSFLSAMKALNPSSQYDQHFDPAPSPGYVILVKCEKPDTSVNSRSLVTVSSSHF